MAVRSRFRRRGWHAAALVAISTTAVTAGRWIERERALTIDRMCDDIYVAPSGDFAAEITPEMKAWMSAQRRCVARGSLDHAACALTGHADETNPRNRHERAYTSSSPHSCQVQISTVSSNGIQFTQLARPTNRVPRSYRIRVD